MTGETWAHRMAAAAAVAVLMGMTGCGGDDGSTAQPGPTPSATTASATPSAAVSPSASEPAPSVPAPTARWEVSGRKVTAGPRTVDAKLGSEVVIEVITDAADELHVHGYDKKAKVAPGTPARISFPATIAGVFEVELHSGLKLGELRVR